MTDDTNITVEAPATSATTAEDDVEILMSALRKIMDVEPTKFAVSPGGTPTFVKVNQRVREIAGKALLAVQVRQAQRQIEADNERWRAQGVDL